MLGRVGGLLVGVQRLVILLVWGWGWSGLIDGSIDRCGVGRKIWGSFFGFDLVFYRGWEFNDGLESLEFESLQMLRFSNDGCWR